MKRKFQRSACVYIILSYIKIGSCSFKMKTIFQLADLLQYRLTSKSYSNYLHIEK